MKGCKDARTCLIFNVIHFVMMELGKWDRKSYLIPYPIGYGCEKSRIRTYDPLKSCSRICYNFQSSV